MMRTDVTEAASRGAILFALFGSPVAWTLHLLGSYLIVSVWCATRWNGMPVAVAVFTLACALTAAASGVVALRGWRRSRATLRSDREPGEPEGWDARMGERGARITATNDTSQNPRAARKELTVSAVIDESYRRRVRLVAKR